MADVPDAIEGEDVEEPTETETPPQPLYYPLLLEQLYYMEAFQFSTDITLTVGSLMITGIPIPMSEYVHRVGAIMAKGFGDAAERERRVNPERADGIEHMGEALRERYEDEADMYKIPPMSEDADEEARKRHWEHIRELKSVPRNHIMLKRVTIKGAGTREVDIPFWRGRLAHVTGWAIGRHGFEDYEGEDPDRYGVR